VFDGAPLCSSGSAADFGNDIGFGEVDVLRQRLLVGVSYRRELLQIGAELITDLLRPDAAQSDPAVAQALRCDEAGQSCRPSARQWTWVLALGAAF
jgi:hypothetical protein